MSHGMLAGKRLKALLRTGVSAISVRSPTPVFYFGPPDWGWNGRYDYDPALNAALDAPKL